MLLKIAWFALMVGLVLFVKAFVDKKKTGKISNVKLLLISTLITFGVIVIFFDADAKKENYEVVEMQITVLEKKEGKKIGTRSGLRSSRLVLRPTYKVGTVEQGKMVVSNEETFEQMIEGETYTVWYDPNYEEITHIRDLDLVESEIENTLD